MLRLFKTTSCCSGGLAESPILSPLRPALGLRSVTKSPWRQRSGPRARQKRRERAPRASRLQSCYASSLACPRPRTSPRPSCARFPRFPSLASCKRGTLNALPVQFITSAVMSRDGFHPRDGSRRFNRTWGVPSGGGLGIVVRLVRITLADWSREGSSGSRCGHAGALRRARILYQLTTLTARSHTRRIHHQ